MVFGAGFFPSIAAAVVVRLEDGSLPAAPMWLVALGGVLAGYLIGGGVVWGVRVLGSLAFNKEAMGLGDVHLLAAVGACLGWIDATVALFAGAFVGLALYPVTSVLMRSSNRTLPFGPSLAIAAALVFFAKPALEWGLGQILGQPIDLP
jgi:leader peptidase (prepilin peptidase)/N-methyltransferase